MRLRKMSAEEFERFREFSVADYGREIAEAGRMPAQAALKQAQDEFDGQLTKGVDTPDHFVLVIEASEEAMGFIWYQFGTARSGRKYAFLCDFYVMEIHRRKGVAAQALSLLERDAITNGCTEVRLFVWAHNAAANALYRKCGYLPAKLEDDGMLMRKTLKMEE